jgi:hypothetical protein
MSKVKYHSITNIRFDNTGRIITITDDRRLITRLALSSSDDDDVNGPTSWSAGKTIFELQNTAFTDVNSAIVANTRTPLNTTEPISLKKYYIAIQSVVNYNFNAIRTAEENNLNEYPQIVFYNQYNEDIDYRQYENMLKTRDFIKAKMDYINNVPGTLSHEQNINYMNGIYTSTLVSILATSLLYLVFVHLR